MQASKLRLYINIDHVATLRQARRGAEPDPVEAAIKAERSGAGADGITAHLREDRRHIQDDDIRRLRSSISSYFNLEMACTDEMVGIALDTLPAQVTLVPERREEVTTEGGLDVKGNAEAIERVVLKLKEAGIRTSLFIDPDISAVEWSQRVGAEAVELHTGQYAHHPDDPATLQALVDATHAAVDLGLAVHAGHGLTPGNVGSVAAILPIEELNIGHSIISRSIFVGLEIAIREVRDAMDRARREAIEQSDTL